MACRGPDDDPNYAYQQIKRQREEIDKLTQMLCGTCSMLDRLEVDHEVGRWPKGLKTWWKKHQKLDRDRKAAQRRAREKDRQKKIADAVDTLTALGVPKEDLNDMLRRQGLA